MVVSSNALRFFWSPTPQLLLCLLLLVCGVPEIPSSSLKSVADIQDDAQQSLRGEAPALSQHPGYGSATRVVLFVVEGVSGPLLERALLRPNAVPALRSLVLRGSLTTSAQCILPARANWLALVTGRARRRGETAAQANLADAPDGMRGLALDRSASTVNAVLDEALVGTTDDSALPVDGDEYEPFWARLPSDIGLEVATSVREPWLDSYFARSADRHFAGASDGAVTLAALDFLQVENPPTVLVVGLASPRDALRTFGVRSREYAKALEAADADVGAVLAALDHASSLR